MARDSFLHILTFLHFEDNEDPPNRDDANYETFEDKIFDTEQQILWSVQSDRTSYNGWPMNMGTTAVSETPSTNLPYTPCDTPQPKNQRKSSFPAIYC